MNPMNNKINPFDAYHETIEKLSGDGILIVAGDPPNPMTIGWGTLGVIWGIPIFTVFVRPTRFTFQLMEKSIDFSVNVLPDEYKKQLSFCGTRSGRNTDKIKDCGFVMENCIEISTPYIEQAIIHYECRIVEKNKLDPGTLVPLVIKRYYPLQDFHTVYYGEIVGAYRKS
jgi:flavin reductase (DIM6/NTAB) family NADH-FMN oxidoreductase RutF